MRDFVATLLSHACTADFAGLVCGVGGTLLLAIKSRRAGWGFVAYLVSNVAWMAFAYDHALTKLLAQHAIFTVSSLIGVWMWLIRPRFFNSPGGQQ